jgi:hypothetical protein
MPSTTITIDQVLHFARTIPELVSLFPDAGWAQEPALTIANDVMQRMLAQPMNWKWNRQYVAPFCTVALQQDYIGVQALYSTYPSIIDMGWLEACTRVDINNTSIPKPLFPMEAVRDLQPIYMQAQPFGICWVPVPLAIYGTWLANTLYPTGLGATTCPASPIQQIIDSNGNYLFVSTWGTTGTTAPYAPMNATPGTTVSDGTVVWTVADPAGAALRMSTLPPSSGIVWSVYCVYQKKAPKLNSLTSLITPIPDDYSYLFRQGFISMLRKHQDAGDRKSVDAFQQWLLDLNTALRAADREQQAFSFYPSSGITGAGSFGYPLGPANPYAYGQW